MTIAEENMAHQLAEARLAVYRFLLAALDKPSPRQHAWLGGADTVRLGGATVNSIRGPVTIDAGANPAGTSDTVILQERIAGPTPPPPP